MVFQATQSGQSSLSSNVQQLSVEQSVDAGVYLVGFEDTNGNFVEVGRLNNALDDVTEPLEIEHQNSGERIAVDSSGFETSGDIAVGGSVQSTDELNFRSLTSDPQSPSTGDMWYRSDIDVFRLQTNSGVQSLTTTEQTNLVPNSVVHQYIGDNFSSTEWTESVGAADMSINGVSANTLNSSRSASSDGVDDVGLADGPQDLPQNATFGIAMVIRSSDLSDNSHIFGARGSNGSFFRLFSNDSIASTNEFPVLGLRPDSSRSELRAVPNTKVIDGSTHLFVINKNGADITDTAFFIDDMQTPTGATIPRNGVSDPNSYANTADMGFFALNDDDNGSITNHKSLDLPFIEFNEQPYSQQERLNLKQRAPGL
jgi:hypothetical protein